MYPPVRARYLLICPQSLSFREAKLANALAATGELSLVVPKLDAPLVTAKPAGVRVMTLRALSKMRLQTAPQFVVYASPPSPALHWRIWWWTRRRAPDALLGGYWTSSPAPAGWWQRRTAHWAWDSLDFWFSNDARSPEDTTAEPEAPSVRRLMVGDSPAGVPEFLERRRQAEERSVLWVDDDLSLNSPSTKHLVTSLPHLRAEGWEVRGWCLSADDTARAGAEIRPFPAAPARLRLFAPYWFFGAVNLHGIGQTILKGRPPARIVHTVGSAFLGADIAAIHFVHHLWLRKQLTLRPRSRKAVLELLWTALAMGRDQLQYRNPRCRLLLPVSDSIADAVRAVCRPDMEVEVLPNSYDEARFNPQVRAQWRSPQRQALGFTESDFVFCFASQGHYRRKGFWLAVDSLARVRAAGRGTVRLLVVGGAEGTLEGLRGELTRRQPGWGSWVTFTGTQPRVERYLSAADAFLFPSYFEAFCLAEIENGALGLPLLLTPHPGTEMILRDGVNGLRLSFDPAEMAAQLADFLDRGLPPFTASPGRALPRAEYARALAGIYRKTLASTG